MIGQRHLDSYKEKKGIGSGTNESKIKLLFIFLNCSKMWLKQKEQQYTVCMEK